MASEAPPSEPGSPTSAPGVDAIAAYRALGDAWRRGDAATYFGGFGDALSCFHRSTDVSRTEVQNQRQEILARNARNERPFQVHSMETRVLAATSQEVRLADFGWSGMDVEDEQLVFHQKLVVLSNVGGRWLVTAETPLSRPGCGEDVSAVEPPMLWASLRSWWRELKELCVGPPGSTLDDGYPGLGGSIGCSPELSTAHGLSCREATDACAKANGELRRLGLGVEEG
ncbi:MAG: hypothetical protein AAGF12_40295 [Myxococcota bacterium]